MSSNITQLSLLASRPVCEQLLDADIPFYLSGPPGIGKSEFIRDLAKDRGMNLVDLRLSQLDPVDLFGMPVREERDGVAGIRITPPDWAAPVLKGIRKPCLLFLDELNLANQSVLAAAYKVILDRSLGQHPMNSKVRIACAGNRAVDKSSVQRLPAALVSRMAHIEIVPDIEAWTIYAIEEKIHEAVIGFVRFRPETFCAEARADQSPWPNPRAWERVSNLLLSKKAHKGLIPGLVGALVGESTCAEFMEFMATHDKLPAYEDILKDPKKAIKPKKADVACALASMIWNRIKLPDMKTIMQYIMTWENEEFRTNAITGLMCQRRLGKHLAVNRLLAEWHIKSINEKSI